MAEEVVVGIVSGFSCWKFRVKDVTLSWCSIHGQPGNDGWFGWAGIIPTVISLNCFRWQNDEALMMDAIEGWFNVEAIPGILCGGRLDRWVVDKSAVGVFVPYLNADALSGNARSTLSEVELAKCGVPCGRYVAVEGVENIVCNI